MNLPSLAEVSSAHSSPGHDAFRVAPDDMLLAELEAAGMVMPTVPVSGYKYFIDGTVLPDSAEITQAEQEALTFCLALGAMALERGNPPVGAVLLDNARGLTWGALTIDKTTPHVLGHAEVRVYNQAQPTVGDRLQDCTLVTTAQPCNTCTSPYAEGKIGRIVYAAPRPAIFVVSGGLMRPRGINMPDLLCDGETETHVIEGHASQRALMGFATWGILRTMGKVRS